MVEYLVPPIPDAPHDGRVYGRCNGRWVPLEAPVEPGPTGPTGPPVEPSFPPDVTLQDIDGGPNYYSNANLHHCVAAGFDDPSFFPIGVWLAAISIQDEVNRWHDLGFNCLWPLAGGGPNGYTNMELVKKSGLWIAQVIHDNTVLEMIDKAGPETVCINVVDEPERWDNPDIKDVVQIFRGTHRTSMPNYRGSRICDGRAVWVGFTTPQYGFGPPGFPNEAGAPQSMEEALSLQLEDGAGTRRHIDLIAADWYWLSVPDEGALLTSAGFYGFWDNQTGGPKADGVPLTTSGTIRFRMRETGHQFEAGAAIAIGYWGSRIHGRIVSYDDATGEVVMDVEGGILDQHGMAAAAGGDNCGVQVSLTYDQAHRPSHYGDAADTLRPWQKNKFPAPIGQYPENGVPYTSQNFFVAPEAMQAAVWSSIMHGARWIVYFNHSFGLNTGFIADNLGHPKFQQPHDGHSKSIYEATKETNHLVHLLAPVINSKFALNYVAVQGDNKGGHTPGFNLPWPVGPNKVNGIGNHNTSLASAFEVMAKYYEGPSDADGVLRKNRFYIWCMYRGSMKDKNIKAMFMLADTSATIVTRISPTFALIRVTDGMFEDTFEHGASVGVYRVD